MPFLILTISIMILFDKQQDVVDIYLNLTNEFYLINDIFCNIYPLE